MKTISSIVSLALFLTLASCSSFAQEGNGSELAAGEQSTNPKSTRDAKQDQANVGGFGELMPAGWSFGSGYQVLGIFDDNVFGTDSFQESDTISQFSADFSALRRTRRAKLEFRYMPEFDVHQHYSPFNSFSQGYAQNVSYELTRHTDLNWQLGARTISLRNALPFSFISPQGFAFSPYNPQALQNGVDVRAGNTSLGIEHRLSKRTRLNVNMLSSVISFSKLGNQSLVGQPRLDYSDGIEASIEHDISKESTIGIQETSTYFAFVDPGRHEFLHAVQGTFNRKLGHDFTAQIAAGPSFSQGQQFTGRASQSQGLNYAVDAGLRYQNGPSTLFLNFSRGQELGLVESGITSESVTLGGQRTFARRWLASFSGGYSRADSVTILASTQGLVTTGRLEYRVSDTLSAVSTYSFFQQRGDNASPIFGRVARNQIGIGFRYIPNWFDHHGRRF